MTDKKPKSAPKIQSFIVTENGPFGSKGRVFRRPDDLTETDKKYLRKATKREVALSGKL